ncbi:MAG: hypothetical protein AMXMBFR4_19760 [Candidatus Hydrogenedentota bacterium]
MGTWGRRYGSLLACFVLVAVWGSGTAARGQAPAAPDLKVHNGKEGREKDKDRDRTREKDKSDKQKDGKRLSTPTLGAQRPAASPEPAYPTPQPVAPLEEVESEGGPPAAEVVDAETEGTTPPRPRIIAPEPPETSGAVLPPPPTEARGVSQQPPPTPPLPVNPDRPKTGPPAGENEIYLDFQGQTLREVIASIGPIIGKNILMDANVNDQQTVTLITHAPIPREMVLPIFESILASYQYKLVETADGNLVKIRPIAEDREQAPLVIDETYSPTGYEGYSFMVVPIKHAAATEISQLLLEVGSKESKVTVYERTNMLLLYGTAASLRKMLDLIEQVDIQGYDEVVEFFALEFTRAEVIAEQIQKVLMGDQAQPSGAPQQPVQTVVRPPTQVRPPARPGMPAAQATQEVIGAEALTLRITPDERLNALIVVASQPLMERVRDLVEKLDTPTPSDANNMHVRELLHADAEKVEEALNNLIGGTGGGIGRSSTTRSTTGRAGTGAGTAGATTGSTGFTGGGPGEIQPFEKQVTITRYDQTNSLLIIASPQDYKVIDSVIAQLDVPSRQVHVEAIIMEVAINDRFRLAVESAGLTANDYFALNNVVSLANVLSGGPLASLQGSDNVLTAGLIDGTTDITFSDGAGGTITQEVPNVPLLLTALEALTALDVLSRPSLITVDNEQANIVDGQEVPVVTGAQRPLDSTPGAGAGFGSVFTQTDRREIGVKLTVTPQISEGNYVFLDLEIEVSRPIVSTIGIDPNASGPTFSLSKITNKVVVREGSTGVLGGLISESTDRGRRQTPILGDIPGLGWLFGRRESTRVKRNLVVLITPHIVKEGIDYQRLTDAQMSKASKANADVFFERGIIKKISQKAYERSRYRPTTAAIEEVTGGSVLQRGDVEK